MLDRADGGDVPGGCRKGVMSVSRAKIRAVYFSPRVVSLNATNGGTSVFRTTPVIAVTVAANTAQSISDRLWPTQSC